MKKFLTFLLTCVLFITSSMPVFAMTNDKVSTETQVEIQFYSLTVRKILNNIVILFQKRNQPEGQPLFMLP